MTYAILSKLGARSVNEDSAACAELGGGDFCFVVADGLGGHGHGDVASKTVTDVFMGQRAPGGASPRGFLATALQAAQDALITLKSASFTLREMKTTSVALAIIGGSCAWGHAGDSRLYFFRGRAGRLRLKARTLDHSLPQQLVKLGKLQPREIAGHPQRNVVTRVFGDKWDTPQYELSRERKLPKHGAFLLCSDGFWEHLPDKAAARALVRGADAQAWLDAMTAEVERNGARASNMDNYTAIAIVL
jgi:serine/threonine protein phosphatase PrpC